MLDNLRNQASSSPLFQEEESPPEAPKRPKTPRRQQNLARAFGLNAQRRFFLAFMLFIVVALLGSALLLITGKVVPPFLVSP